MDEKKKIRPFLPIDGSETAHTLLIPLQKFKINHHTYKDEKNSNDPSFIGREKLTYRLGKLLNNTTGSRGSYLIAGYRGSGKTSLINRVTNKYKNEIQDKDSKNQLINININLGHDATLDTRHVLFNIINLLKKEFSNNYQENKSTPFITYITLLISVCSLVFFLMFFSFTETDSALKNCNIQIIGNTSTTLFSDECTHKKIENKRPDSYDKTVDKYFPEGWKNLDYFFKHPALVVSIMLLLFFLIFILPVFSIWFQEKFVYSLFLKIGIGKYIKSIRSFKLLKKITNLHDRVAYSFENDIGVVALRTAGFGFKNTTKIPEMKEPQIELELLSFLEECNDNHFNIIMVFDELDKISLNVTEVNTVSDNETEQAKHMFKGEDETLDEWLYRRKKRVDSLLGSLKTLITIGQARFFFIAGRDMLDSYQAEKGSTSSLYESLFNHVFEVPSLLTDESDRDETRLHSMIEYYVCSRLISEVDAKNMYLAKLLADDITSSLAISKQGDSICLIKIKQSIKSTLRKLSVLRRIVNVLQSFDQHPSFKKRIDKKEDIVIISNDIIRSIIFKNLPFDKYSDKKIEAHYQKNNTVNIKYKYYQLNTYYLYLIYHDGIDENDARVVILTLRQFINYLTIHSWGNCKRLSTLFESFIRPYQQIDTYPNAMSWLPNSSGQTQYMLKFGTMERQRINMGSNLYIMFSHHLSRQFTGADKLVVSTMAALHYCLKFHRYAFSRHQLFRMTEMMSIYSSPELNNIFEATITQSLWPYLRVIRSGISRYRFFSWIEQEIRYIARINDLESASYTFSLDAINDIKAHYRKTLNGIRKVYGETSDMAHERGPSLISEINIVLGDIYFLERAYDEAVVYYQTAAISHHTPKLGEEGGYDLDCLLRYVEALLKLGNVQEYRQRFDRAAMNYHKARMLVDNFLGQLKGYALKTGHPTISVG